MKADLVWMTYQQSLAFEYAACAEQTSADGAFVAQLAQRYLDSETKQDAQDEWKGMPEFEQNDEMPCRRLVVNFKSEQDAQDFAKLVGQKLTDKTRFIWHPEVKPQRTEKVYAPVS